MHVNRFYASALHNLIICHFVYIAHLVFYVHYNSQCDLYLVCQVSAQRASISTFIVTSLDVILSCIHIHAIDTPLCSGVFMHIVRISSCSLIAPATIRLEEYFREFCVIENELSRILCSPGKPWSLPREHTPSSTTRLIGLGCLVRLILVRTDFERTYNQD